MGFGDVLWIAAGVAAYLLFKPTLKALVNRKKMAVTVKLDGVIVSQQIIRLGTLQNEEKIGVLIGQAIESSPALAGAMMIGRPHEEKIGKLGRRITARARTNRSVVVVTLEMVPAVV